MSKKQIIGLCGKSAAGKDTLLNEVVKNHGYEVLISNTDRPIRPGEKEGREYFFHTKESFSNLIKEDKLIEYREYHTLVNNEADTWRYGLGKRELDPKKKYIVIMDLQGLTDLVRYYGKDNVDICYVDCDDDIRRGRCQKRGDFDETEWKRRLISDNERFNEETLLKLKATIIQSEEGLNTCVNKILKM